MKVKLKRTSTFRKATRAAGKELGLGLTVLVFSVIGVILLRTSSAASPTSIESENGIAARPAMATLDPTASGGSALKFYDKAPPFIACPTEANVIQFNGDSNATGNGGYSRFVDIPGYSEHRVAWPGAAFTMDIKYNGDNVVSIGTQLKQYFDACGVPKIVVIEGSTNDYFYGSTSAQIIQAVRGINTYLSDKNVKVVWVAQQPPPKPNGQASAWSAAMLTARNEYNSWLTTPGNVAGTVADCTTALQDPSQPGWLNPNFYRIVQLDWFTQEVDIKHLNDNGYTAFAGCVQAKIQSTL